jgi:flagellar hook protein FlgE
MPEFKADTDGFMKKPSGFKMKGWSGFHGSSPMQKNKRRASSKRPENAPPPPSNFNSGLSNPNSMLLKTDDSSPMTIGPNLGITADTKTKTEVQDALDHAAGVVESEEKRADRKERKGEKKARKAEKAASQGKEGKAKRKAKKAEKKQRKADKIRAALAPLKKRRKSEIGNKVTHAEGADSAGSLRPSAHKKLAYKKSWGGAGRKTSVVEIDDSPNKKNGNKKVPSIPKKDEAPATTVARLQKKKENGTITTEELKKLQKLQTMMETGPGSYGNEQWDKE